MIGNSTTTEYYWPYDFGSYSITDWAVAGGLVAGSNLQSGNWVYGVEADISATSFDKTHIFYDGEYRNQADMNWLATIRGLAGLAAGNSFFYVTGGLALAKMNYEFGSDARSSQSLENDTLLGSVAGFGLEHDMGNSSSVRGEALFISLPSLESFSYDINNENPVNFTTSASLAHVSMVKWF